MDPPTTTTISNTRQLFATHSLSELEQIAIKFRNDSAKKDAILASALADTYKTLLTATEIIEQIKTTTNQFYHTNAAFKNWNTHNDAAAQSTTTTSPIDVPLQSSTPPQFLTDLDHGWSAQCNGDYVSAIDHLNQVNGNTKTPSIVKTTLNESKKFIALEFTHHQSGFFGHHSQGCQLDKVHEQYRFVQEYLGQSLADMFLEYQKTSILTQLTTSTATDSIDCAIRSAIYVENLGASLNIPIQIMREWIVDIQHEFSEWVKQTKLPPSHSITTTVHHQHDTLNDHWYSWLLGVHFALYQAKVDTFMLNLQTCIDKLVVTESIFLENKVDDELVDVPEIVLFSFKESAAHLTIEPFASPNNLAYFRDQCRVLVDKFENLYKHDTAFLVRSLHATGYVLETWDVIQTKCDPYIIQWTKRFMTNHLKLITEPCSQMEKPSSGIVRFLFELMADLENCKLLQLMTCISKYLTHMSDMLTDQHFRPKLMDASKTEQAGDEAEFCLIDLAFIDRVCGTSQVDSLATRFRVLLGDRFEQKRVDACSLASTAVQGWGLLLLVTSGPIGHQTGFDTNPSLSLQKQNDDWLVFDPPCECIGPQLPVIQVPRLISSIANVSDQHALSSSSSGPSTDFSTQITSSKSTDFIAAASLSVSIPRAVSAASILKSNKISPASGGGYVLQANRVAQYISRANSVSSLGFVEPQS